MEITKEKIEEIETLIRGAIEDFNSEWDSHEKIQNGIESYSIQMCELFDVTNELLTALKLAKTTIRTWHGEQSWELYQKSPEMVLINKALEL